MMKYTSMAIGLAAMGAVGLSGTAFAQSIFGEPTYGTVVLEANFPDDPRTVSVVSGGEIAIADSIEGCTGYISDDPDVRLSFTAGNDPEPLPLTIYVRSDEDTTLVINAPNGQYYCNDDGSEGVDPVFYFMPPMSGDYEIWVGSYDRGQYHDAELNISELGAN